MLFFHILDIFIASLFAFFIFHIFHEARFPSCTLFMLHSFCLTIFSCWNNFYVPLFSCCTIALFHFTLHHFLCYTFLMLLITKTKYLNKKYKNQMYFSCRTLLYQKFISSTFKNLFWSDYIFLIIVDSSLNTLFPTERIHYLLKVVLK